MAANYWESTQRRYWEFTKEQLADVRQRKQDEERSLVQLYPLPEWRHLFIFFNTHLTRLAKRMQVRQQALATAQVYLKRFYCKVEIRRTNPYLAMATALYLACKTEECPQHIRQVVQEAKVLWPDTHCLEIARLGECEFYMISELSSQLIVHAPYRTLNTLQLELSLTAEEFIQAWTVVNDHYMTDLPLLYPPHVIAVAAVVWVLVLQAPTAAAAAASSANNGAVGINNNANTISSAGHTNINSAGSQLGIGMGGNGSAMTPGSLNAYNLNTMGAYNNINTMGSLNMNMGMAMNMGGLNMGMGGMNMSMNMNMGSMGMGSMGIGGIGSNSQGGGAPSFGGTQSSLPPPPPLHMSLSSLSGQGANNTPGGSGTPGGAGGPGTPGMGGAAGTPTTAGGAGYLGLNAAAGGSAMAMVQANARAVVSAAIQNQGTPTGSQGSAGGSNVTHSGAGGGGNTAGTPTEEAPPADGGRAATLQWLFRWLTDSGLDLEATIDCTQELISFYMAGEEYSEKQTREQVNRFIKARGLDR